MKRKLLLMMASLLLAGAVSAQTTNFWENNPNSHAQPSNTPIVASVQIDDVAVTINENMRLGAFVGDDLRGIAAPHDDGKFWIQVFYTAQTDNITFKFYNGTTEYTTCETTLAGSDEGYGTPNAPQVLNFTTTQTMTQTTELAAGWTWWSTPVEQNGINGLEILENSLGSNGVNIKGQNTTVVYLEGIGWMGDCPITNEDSYMINVASNCNVTSMAGIVANPASHPITIKPNWNWIGYPVNQSQTLETAFGSGFTPVGGDVVKGQNSTAVYLDYIGWMGDFTFDPGCGYMYFSADASDRTLTFNRSRNSNEKSFVAQKHWNANYHVAESNLSLFAVVYVDGVEQRSEDLELGAFVNGECRGNARLLYVEPLDTYYAIMTITGDKEDLIEFRLYNAEDGSVNMESSTNLHFVQNDIVGEPNNPYNVYFNSSKQYVETLKVYPNPVNCNESFLLDIPSEEVVNRTIITDLAGNVVSQTAGKACTHQIRISVTGMYFAKVICESGRIYYGRIIVK